MFKRKKLASLILASLIASTNIYANEQSNYSIAVELARAEKVDSLVQKVNELKDYLKLYVYNSGDTTPTINEINNFAGSDLSTIAWQNYDGNSMSLNINTTSSVSFGNLFSTAPSSEVLSFLVNSNYLDPLAKVNSTTYTMTIPFEAELVNFLKATKELQLNSNVVISATAPSDTSKIWYKPDGQGGYTVNGYNPSEGKWVSYGSVNFGSGNGSTSSNIIVKSISELNSIPAVPGLKVYLSDGTSATEYIHDGTDWVKSSTAGSGAGGLFNGDGTILDMATTLISKAGGSVVTASDPFVNTSAKYTYSGVRDFTKKDNTATNGYWVDTANAYVVGSTLADISTQNWANGTYAYLPKTGGGVHLLKRIASKWMYVSDGYVDVVQGMGDAKTLTSSNSTRVWDKKNNQYFRYSTADFWYSTNSSGTNDNITRLTSNVNGRNVFSGLNSTTQYLVLNNDCTSTTCNGIAANDYFAGEMLDGMRVFYYATAGKRKNNLIDAVPATSITDIYNRNLSAGLYNNVVYLKDVDSRNRLCYKNTSGTYYTKAGAVVPTGNNLPPAYTCSTASYSGSYIILSNRTQATDWSDSPHGAGINIGGVNYAHYNANGKDFWTNNGSGDWQQNATEIFTRLSRSAFPNVTHTLNALTKSLGTESRYTTSGVTSSIDSSFKQWFYSSSGTRTANLLDAIPTSNAYTDNTAISVGIALQANKLLTKSGNYWTFNGNTVDKDLISRSSSYIRPIGSSYAGYKDFCTVNGFSFSTSICSIVANYSVSAGNKNNIFGTKVWNLNSNKYVTYNITSSVRQYQGCGEWHHQTYLSLNNARIATGLEKRDSNYSNATVASGLTTNAISIYSNAMIERTPCYSQGTLEINLSYTNE